MKRLLSILFVFLMSFMLCTSCTKQEIQIQEQEQVQDEETELIAAFGEKSNAENVIWVGTFALVWNDLLDTINEGKPITLLPEMPKSAIELNKKIFTKDYISEDSYYIKHGILTQELFDTIKKEIKEKFNETSDILDDIGPTYTFMFYSMLKKDFKFENPFDKLDDDVFGENPNKIKYFGINNKSEGKLRKNVRKISYKDEDNFIIKLLTKGEDEIILYRTDENKTLDKYWADIISYDKDYPIGDQDNLKVPNLDFFYKVSFEDFSGKEIKETGWTIDQAIETVDFKMDEVGVKLKSEAIIVMKNAAVMREEIANYFLDDSFVIFLVEHGKKVPYFGARIKNVSTLNNR